MDGFLGNNDSFIWVILLLCLCGNGFGSMSDKKGFGNDIDCLLPILLLCSCGGGFGAGRDNKCC